ncbi:DUF1415 domain-containing protein [Pseudoalteromonas sp. Cnat2-41]|uniref:DUF1415 domain-containing protein n=1 Tax=unclassified Pseudoalteromonas TaxID=194690 RepID=UPI001EF7F3CA|nr:MULTISPECIES: DUF1415 domain-containing protein [unclassified Pseudoalteromonas]MCF2862218.1 DUF1415 domain-containing protein [Pseudoalteromonas sp. CNAT2-18]MCG7558013.1 DUF1415 domain-containing protein [Pseudoalteromonas sp. CNAT2-18.1]
MSNCVAAMREWVSAVIVKYNFCPFARKEVESQRIHYHPSDAVSVDEAVLDTLEQCRVLDNDSDIETTLVIFAKGFNDFDDFLELIDLANALLVAQGFEGTYQLAHFHPHYVFADAEPEDAANCTNRAPYPALHIIREHSMEQALAQYDDPESIPENNIRLARRKGSRFWQQLLQHCTNAADK